MVEAATNNFVFPGKNTLGLFLAAEGKLVNTVEDLEALMKDKKIDYDNVTQLTMSGNSYDTEPCLQIAKLY